MIHSIPLGYHSYSLYQYKINVYCRNKTISSEVLTNLERICRTSSLHERIRTRPGGSNSHQLSYKFFVIFTSTLFSPDHSANVSYFYNNRQPVNMLQISAHPCCDSRLPYNRVYIVPNIHCIPLCIYHHIYADQLRKVTTSRYSIRLEPSSRPNDPENFVLSTLSGISIHIFLDSTLQYHQTEWKIPRKHHWMYIQMNTVHPKRCEKRTISFGSQNDRTVKTSSPETRSKWWLINNRIVAGFQLRNISSILGQKILLTLEFPTGITAGACEGPHLRISTRSVAAFKPFKFFGQSHGSRIATGRKER